MHVRVLGAGVIGLSTAIRLQQAGYRVAIWAAALPHQTTSNVAAALWYPYKAYPEDRVLAWSSRTYRVLLDLVNDTATGVQMRPGIEIWRTSVPDPWWRTAVPRFDRPTQADLPSGYVDGYVFHAPVIEMPIYLRYLLDQFANNGGQIEQRVVRSLGEATADSPIVINCTGLGARDMIGDRQLAPIRGQIVRVRNPGLDRFILDDEHPEGVTYIVPRSSDCVLGGTATDGDWSTTPDPAVARSIIERCIAIEPRLQGAEILEHKVGLRPGRPSIRLEREELSDGACVIHNYGHGGAGVTLSWGCADEVVGLV